MTPQGPFSADEDKTVFLRPTPGGRMPPPEPVSAQPPPAAAANFAAIGSALPPQSGSLLALAAPLLSLAARFKTTLSYSGVEGLKQQLAKEIAQFQTHALQHGIDQQQIIMASYVLCSFLDETIQGTPWGAQSNWAHQSLLVIFHQEGWGGEGCFQILNHANKQPAQCRQLLELFYVVLSFGFEGQYRVAANGLNELEKIRQELYQLLQRTGGDFAPELSPRWMGQQIAKTSLLGQIPLWVLASIASGVLFLVYLGLLFALNGISDLTYNNLLQLTKEDMPTTLVAGNAPLAAPVVNHQLAARFVPLLKTEISENKVEVVGDNVIRIRNSFVSGSDKIKPEFLPMLAKIAKELENGQDRFLVIGHTDNQPIVSAKFPSNWHLSASRAKNVLAILQQKAKLNADAAAEGRGDSVPLHPNDSAESRALNRRVDILIK